MSTGSAQNIGGHVLGQSRPVRSKSVPMAFPLATPEDRAAAVKAIWGALPDWTVEIDPPHKQRSKAANRFYRAMLIDISKQGWAEDACGRNRQWSPAQWHQTFKWMFLVPVDLPLGRIECGSTTDCNDGEFQDYIHQIGFYATHKLNVRFTDPAENYRVSA